MRTTLSAIVVALFSMALFPATASAAEGAAVEIVSLAGAGARATFAFTAGTGRWCVDNVLEVNASNARQFVPSGVPSTTPHLEVALTQRRCGSGRLLFTGQGTLDNPDFTVSGTLAAARLRGQVTVHNSVGDITRIVTLDVGWTSEGQPEPLVRNESVSLPGSVVNTHHNGNVSQASASGTITVSDPTTTADPITVQANSTHASLWDTADKRITVTTDDGSASRVTANQTAMASSTSSGYWTGYWTWNATTRTWYWTWVWVWSSGGYTIS